VSDIPNDFFADFDQQPRSALAEWFWRIPLLLRWDGILPFLSPITVLSLSILQLPQAVIELFGVLVPIGVALGRAGIAQRQIGQVCGDRGTLDRQFSVAIAIILLLILDITSTILVIMNAGFREWAMAALLYVGYVGAISYALRRPRSTAPGDEERLSV
jgi:hypothetical protein